MTRYDIGNPVNFTGDFSLLIKVGEFIFNNPHDQELVINKEMIEWPVGFKEV